MAFFATFSLFCFFGRIYRTNKPHYLPKPPITPRFLPQETNFISPWRTISQFNRSVCTTHSGLRGPVLSRVAHPVCPRPIGPCRWRARWNSTKATHAPIESIRDSQIKGSTSLHGLPHTHKRLSGEQPMAISSQHAGYVVSPHSRIIHMESSLVICDKKREG